ncbi:Nup93/Nic96-domain-containing protein [Podospora australis]|uniref:Nup93/Nic96-domain-containing protein n=1 Tax=Podospora australis TaxID=1536484 RepID=A0AAN7AHV8_9PEZI|nr:Nup93/Nic96-domain-containing protein [Podospora australis]
MAAAARDETCAEGKAKLTCPCFPQDHYIGIDVGTGSARACIIDATGEIKALASHDIKLWQPSSYGGSHYASEQSTTDIWQAICYCVRQIISESKIDTTTMKGIGFDATCSLAVFTHDTDEPVPVTGPDFSNDGNDRNVILWLDHRPLAEAEKINDTKHNLLRYVGGTMSVEMEIPKVLWLKNNMPPELFDRCKFYDLADALTHIATGNETRSYCSAVCKQGFVPVGVDGSVKGWQEDFYETIGLGDLARDDFKRVGGVNGVSGSFLSAGELVGGLSEKAAKELGLPAGIAIGSGVIDAYAGWIGTVGAKVKLSPDHLDDSVALNDVSQAFTRLASVAGTSTCHLAMSKEPVFVPGVWGPYRDVLIPDFWMAEGGQSATGELMKHMLETHAAYDDTLKEAKDAGKNIYDYLNGHLRHLAETTEAPSISYLVRHFFFYGDLWGNRSPIADPNMRGAIIGMSSDKSKDGMALLYYSTMEFIALQTRQIVETMNKAGHSILSIFMSGSQCQNEILMDLIATACDMPVLIPRYVNAAVVHGAAMLGAKAASAKENGETEPLWDIMDRMSKPGKVVRSKNDPAEKKLLDAKYEVFLDQCRTQQEYRRKIDEALKGKFHETAMSFFGAKPAATPAPAAGGGGLFGNTTNQGTTTPQTGGGGLFGGGAGASTTPATSLFGAKPATTAAGTTTGQPAAATGGTGLFGLGNSVFGQSTASTTTPQASLFGATTTTPGAATTQAAPATSLFGSTLGGGTTATNPATTTAATGGSGLFGLGGTTAVASTQPAATGGMPPATGLGGGLGALGGLGAFGATNTTAAPTASTNLATAGASTATNAGNLPTGAFFDSLLAKNKKQATGESALGDLPSLQLGLGDLRQRLKKLGPKAEGGRALEHGKAHYFLAASGVDPGAAVRDLGALGLHAARDKPSAPGGYGAGVTELDVEAYLNNLQTKTTLSMIADGLDRSVRDFDTFLEDNVTMEWEAQRKRIYSHFGIKPREEGKTVAGGEPSRARAGTPAKDGRATFGRSGRKASHAGGGGEKPRASVFGRSGLQKSVIGTPSRIGQHASEFSDVEAKKDDWADGMDGLTSMDDRLMREKQGKLADKVRDFNNARQRGNPIYIFRDLAELESKSGDRHGPHLVEAYKAMMEIVGEDPEGGQVPRERHFAQQYLDPNNTSPNAIAMRKQILRGANTFLEKQFYNEVESLIAKYPHEAALGGVPDVVSKIRAYIRLRIARKTLVPDNTTLQTANKEYVWAVVFYLLRAGFVSQAAQYVNNNEPAFRSIDRTFLGYINSYASSEDRRLRRAVQDRCTNEYNQRIRNAPEGSIDPFRMACYKIIGRCDVSNRSLDGLQTDVNDWVWLQFNLAREADRSTELAGESYGLAELQSSIREIGQKHFPKTPADDTNGSFGMFFYLQVLAGMFEQAVAYMYPFSYVDAVHFAIALSYYGLLRTADATSPNELLSFNTRTQPQINFGRMLGYYTRDFRAANPAAAVDYLVLICLNADETPAGQQQASLCHEALRELVLESRDFSKLIGDIKPDGSRIKGLIEERGPLIALAQEDDFIRIITLQAASYADDNGRTTDAVLLYHLAGDYDTVVTIVSRALSEAISLDIGEDPMRLIPVKPRVAFAAGTAGQDASAAGSLSLAAIDDPVELARTMMGMYEKDYMFWQHIREPNRLACTVLLQMSEIKKLVEAGKWIQCLEKIKALDILPLSARGDQAIIRNYSARFAGLAQPVAINVPNLLMWTVICCTRQRERLMHGSFNGNPSTARLLIDELKQYSVDLTAYTSQLRYRLPSHLHEALARASAE